MFCEQNYNIWVYFEGYVPGSIAVKEKLKFDVQSLAKYLKKTLNIKTDGNCLLYTNES